MTRQQLIAAFAPHPADIDAERGELVVWAPAAEHAAVVATAHAVAPGLTCVPRLPQPGYGRAP